MLKEVSPGSKLNERQGEDQMAPVCCSCRKVVMVESSGGNLQEK